MVMSPFSLFFIKDSVKTSKKIVVHYFAFLTFTIVSPVQMKAEIGNVA